MVGIPFKLEHGVHNVLQHFGAGDAAFLGDMPDENYRHMGLLGKPEQLGRTIPHLGDGTRCRFNILRSEGLDRIDDEQSWFHNSHMGQDRLEAGLRKHLALSVANSKPFCTELQLLRALFTGNVKGLFTCLEGHLECQGRFPYTRLTTDENQ